jgi:hypothetical protein
VGDRGSQNALDKRRDICSLFVPDMNAHADIAAETPADASDQDAGGLGAPVFDPDGERTETMLCKLARLSEICMELAEIVGHQATAQRDLQDVAQRAGVKEVIEETIVLEVRSDFGAIIAKIARAVRVTIMLEDKLMKERRLRLSGLEEQREVRRKAAEETDAQARKRGFRIRRNTVDVAVRETIRLEQPDRESREPLFEALEELWEDEEYQGLDRWDAWSIGETIAAFCKELGVKPDWDRWKDDDWAVEEARANTPGSPYAATTGPPPNSG